MAASRPSTTSAAHTLPSAANPRPALPDGQADQLLTRLIVLLVVMRLIVAVVLLLLAVVFLIGDCASYTCAVMSLSLYVLLILVVLLLYRILILLIWGDSAAAGCEAHQAAFVVEHSLRPTTFVGRCICQRFAVFLAAVQGGCAGQAEGVQIWPEVQTCTLYYPSPKGR